MRRDRFTRVRIAPPAQSRLDQLPPRHPAGLHDGDQRDPPVGRPPNDHFGARSDDLDLACGRGVD
jgi:hypothetical protein